jgi:hypothetical protein
MDRDRLQHRDERVTEMRAGVERRRKHSLPQAKQATRGATEGEEHGT